MLYRGKNGAPGRIMVTGAAPGNWYHDCIGVVFDALIVTDTNVSAPSHVIMETEYNKDVLPSRLITRLPEKARYGLTVGHAHSKIIASSLDSNEAATELLKNEEWL